MKRNLWMYYAGIEMRIRCDCSNKTWKSITPIQTGNKRRARKTVTVVCAATNEQESILNHQIAHMGDEIKWNRWKWSHHRSAHIKYTQQTDKNWAGILLVCVMRSKWFKKSPQIVHRCCNGCQLVMFQLKHNMVDMSKVKCFEVDTEIVHVLLHEKKRQHTSTHHLAHHCLVLNIFFDSEFCL